MNPHLKLAYDHGVQQALADKKASLVDGWQGDEMLAAGGGYLAARKALPKLTGRELVFHGTTKEMGDKILREGLKPGSSTGIRTAISEKFPEAWRQYGYVTDSPLKAKLYELQARAKSLGLGPEWLAEANPLEVHRNLKPAKGSIVGMSIPAWMDDAPKLVVNPETAGGYKAWKGRLPVMARAFTPEPELLGTYLTQTAGNERAVTSVPSKYIRGSKDYQRLTLGELGSYLKRHPGRVAGGVGLAGLGLAGLGYAGKSLHDYLTEETNP
jgi:hypothetical protein